MRYGNSLSLLAALLLFGCGGDSSGGGGGEPTPGPEGCEPPHRIVGDACLAPGVQDDGCPAGTLGQADGSCRPAGILEGECSEGFVHDGEVGCEPILPAEPCPDGLMAIPGETACRPVMDCGSGKWGDIPVDATTQYVDQSFVGVSDGSADAPWTTITEGIVQAPKFGIVAIAAGSYVEDLNMAGLPRQLWGVCPEQVELVGANSGALATVILTSAGGAELHGLSITGDNFGVFVSGGDDEVLLEHLHIHDTSGMGVIGQDDFGVPSIVVRSSLFERNMGGGIQARSSQLVVEDSLFRDGIQLIQGISGRGIRMQTNNNDVGSSGSVHRSVFERMAGAGIFIGGSEATLEQLVVRDTREADGKGRGIIFHEGETTFGPSRVTLRGSLVEQSIFGGIYISGSEATIETIVVRDTAPNAAGERGRGVAIRDGELSELPSVITLERSLIESASMEGLVISGSEAEVTSVVVRDTLPQSDGLFGRGVSVFHSLTVLHPSVVTLAASTVTGNRDIGVLSANSNLVLEGTHVSATSPAGDGFFGDGVLSLRQLPLATLEVRQSLIEDSERAGLVTFGGPVSLQASAIRCAAFPLAGEDLELPFTFEDGGANACGCPDLDATCKVASVGLEPPSAAAVEPAGQ